MIDHITVLFSGHSDTVMGVICTNNEELCNRLRFLQNCKAACRPIEFSLLN